MLDTVVMPVSFNEISQMCLKISTSVYSTFLIVITITCEICFNILYCKVSNEGDKIAIMSGACACVFSAEMSVGCSLFIMKPRLCWQDDTLKDGLIYGPILPTNGQGTALQQLKTPALA